MTFTHRFLANSLRLLGAIDMTAVVLAFVPDGWIAWCHAELGLGTIPSEPVVGYLARSGSLMYALHGLTVFYISFDLPRYWNLVRLLAAVSLLHGGLMTLVDVRVGMPAWWTILEGPCFAATGAATLVLQAYAGEPASADEPSQET